METKLWKTIKIGTSSKKGLLSTLEKSDVYVSSWAKELIKKMPLEATQTVDLCKMTLAEMGFTKSATWKEILDRVRELGNVCPPEIGPLLRIQDTDQQKRSWYWIVMEPITDSGGDPDVFYLRRYDDGGLWLRTGWVSPDCEWRLGHEFVFRLR